jgi:hypothetical protein
MRYFLLGFAITFIGLLASGVRADGGGDGMNCPPGNKCCTNPLPAICYNQPCGATGEAGVCLCCIVNGTYTCQNCPASSNKCGTGCVSFP